METSLIQWGDLVHPAVPHVTGRAPLTGRVATAIEHIEKAIGRRGDSVARHAPSAGAIYPYEVLLCRRDGGVPALVDLARRRLVVGDDFPTDEPEYLALLVGRPWLSMRRYGPRGFLYHLVDSGHALLNLALLSRRHGWWESPGGVTVGALGQGRVPLAAGLIAA
ncbi:hypothetical protein, partial [Rhodococcus sp. NPDC058514]